MDASTGVNRPVVLEFTFSIVTPMFLGGADNTRVAEIRPNTFKDVLRWWYRALHPRLTDSEEDFLFGSVRGDEPSQGAVLFHLKPGASPVCTGAQQFGTADAGIAYLGYGLLQLLRRDAQTPNMTHKSLRPFVNPGQSFTMRLTLRPDVSEEQRKSLYWAIRVMSLLGGLGARSRRGWGSFYLTSSNGEALPLPETPDAHAVAIRSALRRFPALTQPPGEHTCFSDQAQIAVKKIEGDWKAALGGAGAAMMKARRNFRGNSGIFRDDHDLVAAFLDDAEGAWKQAGRNTAQQCQGTAALTTAPERLGLGGLPHNYFFSSRRDRPPEKAEFKVVTAHGQELDRRASPLLLHIHPLHGGGHLAVYTFMPSSTLLPAGSELLALAKTGNANWWVDARIAAPTGFRGSQVFLDYLKKNGWQVGKIGP